MEGLLSVFKVYQERSPVPRKSELCGYLGIVFWTDRTNASVFRKSKEVCVIGN